MVLIGFDAEKRTIYDLFRWIWKKKHSFWPIPEGLNRFFALVFVDLNIVFLSGRATPANNVNVWECGAWNHVQSVNSNNKNHHVVNTLCIQDAENQATPRELQSEQKEKAVAVASI